MSTSFVDPAMSIALSIIIKASVLLGIAAIIQGLFRQRASAETRHLVWTLAMLGLLLLPILALTLPDWPVVIPTIATKTADAPVVNSGVDEAANAARPPVSAGPGADGVFFVQPAGTISASMVVATVYAAGVLVVWMSLGIQWRNVRRLTREASEIHDPAWTRLFNECADRMGVHRPVRLLRSRERSMPMAWGTCRPAVLIPSIAETWAEDRRRAVILHELAHVARYDCLTQTLAFAACAVYWFHPVTWWVARRLRVERELACDDRVIAAGTQAREYAGHLLEIAYTFGNQRARALAVSMARPRQLESRMLAALDVTRNRRVPPLRVQLAGVAIAAMLLLSVAVVTPTIAAADMLAERAPAAPTASAAPRHEAVMAPHLKPAQGIVTDAARRMTRAAAAAIRIAQDNLPGTWEIRATSTDGTVHLRLVEVNSSSGSNIPVTRLEGLTAAQLAGAGGPVQFRLRRDAGTFTFEGVLRNGVGAGTFSFAPDPNFPMELAKRGFARPTAREQYQLARHDVGFGFVDELNKQGYAKPETPDLVRAGQHGVQVTYLRDMGALGYRLGSLEPLIKLRDHGVTPEYIRELTQLGYKGLSADELRRARDHGISPEYVRGMREAGYGSLPMDELIKARDHGVTPEFVRELGDAGHRKLPLDQLIRVRDHGVSPEYVRELRQLGHQLSIEELVRARGHGVTEDYVRAMRDAGYGSLTMEQFINARDHGVDVEFVRGMAKLGYGSLSMGSLIRVRDHGVTPQYVEELKTLGYDRLAIEDVVSLRDYGLTPDRIRAANARAGTRLPVDMLKSLAAGGMR